MICSNKCYKFTGGYCRASWEGWKWPKKKSPNFDCLKKKKLPKKDCLKACSKFALYCLFVVINISRLQGDIDVLGTLYKGILPCFLGGFWMDFVESFSRSMQMRFLVERGSMMSSTNPLTAAGKGLLNFSMYSCSLAGTSLSPL